MLRRIYMLFPQREAVQQTVEELEAMGISRRNMHTIAQPNVDISGLPEATARQKNDTAAKLEQILWNLNLALFFSALLVWIAALFAASWLAVMISTAVMLITLFAGHYFASHVPHAHLDECRAAISRDEIVLLVDVPRWHVRAINKAIGAHHPDMHLGAVSWTLEGL